MVTSSPGVGNDKDPFIDELTGQPASTRANIVSLTANMSNLKVACNKAEREHESVVKKVQAEAKTSVDRIIAEWNGASSHYRGVLQSF